MICEFVTCFAPPELIKSQQVAYAKDCNLEAVRIGMLIRQKDFAAIVRLLSAASEAEDGIIKVFVFCTNFFEGAVDVLVSPFKAI